LPRLTSQLHGGEPRKKSGTQVAVQIKDYLADGIIRNAVNLPALSADQYRRVRPYLELAERSVSGFAKPRKRARHDPHSLCWRSC